MSQKKLGIIISYLNLIAGMAVNIFLTPFLISTLGDIDYSIYKVMQSFAGPLAMFHLGISTVVTRSIVKCKNTEDYTEKDKKNTMALAILASSVMSVFLIIAAIVMYTLIPSMYGQTYNADTIKLGQMLFVLFVGSSVFHMLTDAFSGCLVGHQRFTVSSVIPLFKTVFRVVIMFLLLKLGMGVIGVVLADLVIALIIFLFTAWYAIFVLHEIPRLYFFDKKQIAEILSFGVAILLQAFINQVNNNVDTMILGAYVSEKYIITMYSSALAVYAIYNSLISVVTNFFLPKATELVTKNASGSELTDFVIKPGRYQAAVAVACIAGFGLFGRDFITLWIGSKYINAYWIILILMIPVTIPLVENAMIAILDATLKRIYRSAVLVIMAVVNVIATLFLIRVFDFWGAAIGTAASLIIGHGVLMNIYYAKTFKIEVGRMFFSIFKGVLPAGVLASVICIPLVIFIPCSLIFFLIKCATFIVIYGLLLWLIGFNRTEKAMLKGMFIKKKQYRRKV